MLWHKSCLHVQRKIQLKLVSMFSHKVENKKLIIKNVVKWMFSILALLQVLGQCWLEDGCIGHLLHPQPI